MDRCRQEKVADGEVFGAFPLSVWQRVGLLNPNHRPVETKSKIEFQVE